MISIAVLVTIFFISLQLQNSVSFQMENELDGLFQEVYSTYTESIQPVFDGPKLLDGKDLIKIYGLTPGPLFKEILSELELATIEGVVLSREDALAWVEKYLNRES